MKIPSKFVTEGLELAKGATVFGVPLESLTREEAIACAAKFAKDAQQQREQHARDVDFSLSLFGNSFSRR